MKNSLRLTARQRAGRRAARRHRASRVHHLEQRSNLQAEHVVLGAARLCGGDTARDGQRGSTSAGSRVRQ